VVADFTAVSAVVVLAAEDSVADRAGAGRVVVAALAAADRRGVGDEANSFTK
jgi:hypothetical protein